MSNHKHCVPSLNLRKTTDSEICPQFDFGTSLEQVYPLLQIIFEYLYYEDLKSAAAINNIWQKYASKEFKNRNKASWITLIKPQYSKLIIKKSYNFKFDSVALGLIFYKYKTIRLNKYVCVHNDPVTRMTFAEYLTTEILPPKTDFWAFSCSEIYPPELQKGFQCSFAGVFIPEILNVNIKKFAIQLSKIDESLENIFKDDEHIHCTLLFTISRPDIVVKRFTKYILNRQNEEPFALGGGIISGGIKLFHQEETPKIYNSNTLFCIALTQEKGKPAVFDSYSAVIGDNFEEELLKFKDNIKLREDSFAFKICCAAKANKETETSIFNKIFPKTFVVGFDVDGEIGWNKFNSWQPENDTPDVKKSKVNQRSTHEYTTIIVIMTWGKQV